MSTFKWTFGMAVMAICVSPAAAQESIQTAFNYNLGGCACEEPSCEVGEPACCCEEPACCCDEPSGCCDSGCCSNCGCSDCCGCGGSDWGCLGDCCLGDPCTLQGQLQPCCDRSIEYGGWVQFGYYNDFTRFSDQDVQGLSFNDRPNELNWNQAWFYVEKAAEGDCCSADWGFRYDIMYGVDAQKTQAFGNQSPVWDTTFDDGAYGWAMPQAYGQFAYGDWSVIAGHFYTLVGYEVVPATGNFFYSHSYTMFNSEPFTHTGVLASYSASDEVTLHGGWTLGWDTGFDQFDDGSNFLGGFDVQMTDDVQAIYIATAGDFGWRGEGYSHSVVFDATLSDNWNYVLQSDYVNTRNIPDGAGGFFDDTDIGINQYLFYTLNDCWALGTRMEWWKSQLFIPEATSYYELTGGINYKPHANVVVRPEIRYNWTPSDQAYETLTGVDFNQWVFGIDCVMTY